MSRPGGIGRPSRRRGRSRLRRGGAVLCGYGEADPVTVGGCVALYFVGADLVVRNSSGGRCQDAVVCFRHHVSWWSRAEAPEGSGVGLTGLGDTGAHAALEVPVGCHLAFHVPNGNPPATTSETIGPRQRPESKSPSASREDRAGGDQRRLGVGHAAPILPPDPKPRQLTPPRAIAKGSSSSSPCGWPS